MVAPNLQKIASKAAASREDETRRREQLLAHLSYYASRPDEIGARLRELDEEWDADRVIAANCTGVSLFGLLVGLLGRKRWYVIAMIVQGLAIQHAAQRSSVLTPLLRRCGVRTRQEIEQERYALKALRGDFEIATKGEGKAGESRGGGDPDALALKVLRATADSDAMRSGGVRSRGP